MQKPDYARSIVNLMASLRVALGGTEGHYAPLAALPPERLSPPIILFIVDGLGYDRVQTLAGTTLQRHLKGSLDAVFPTTTVSAITSIYTGGAPCEHGMTGWFTWFRELGSVAAVLPFVPRIGGASYTASGINPAQLFGGNSLFSQLSAPGWVVNPLHVAESAYSRACGGHAHRLAYRDLEGLFSQVASTLEGPAGLTLAYWPEYDALCHHQGVHSEGAGVLVREFDAHLARFLPIAAARGAKVIVTADHGMVDTRPDRIIHLENHPALRADLALPLCGEPRTAYCYVHAHRREHFLDYVQTRLAHCCDLFPSGQLVDEGWFGTGAPHLELLHRVGDYTLMLKDDYVITERLVGERPFAQVGVHGGASLAEVRVPLVVIRPNDN